jgi:hypothetical protein
MWRRDGWADMFSPLASQCLAGFCRYYCTEAYFLWIGLQGRLFDGPEFDIRWTYFLQSTLGPPACGPFFAARLRVQRGPASRTKSHPNIAEWGLCANFMLKYNFDKLVCGIPARTENEQ